MKKISNFRLSWLAMLALGLGAPLASAQSTWTYDFANVNDPAVYIPPPAYSTADWTNNRSPGGPSYLGGFTEMSGARLHGFIDSTDPNGWALAIAARPGENGSSTGVYKSNSYDLAAGLTMIMGWCPNPGNLVDDGFYADNEIMQMGLVGSTTSILGIDPSLFLSIVENTASNAADITNSFLAVRTEGGILDYFNGGNTYAFDADKYYMFEIDFALVGGDPGTVSMGLTMDIYDQTFPNSHEYILASTVDFGSIKVANSLAGDASLYPALGITLRDANVVSISGANFDTMAAIPEPGSMALLLISATAALAVRRRR
jgi:hypothetical protein